MALLKCDECGGQVSSSAKICPHCGAKVRYKKKMSRAQLIMACLGGVLLGGALILGENDKPQVYHVPSDPAGFIRPITTAEFQADRLNITNKRVTVVGYAGCLNNLCLLRDTRSTATVTFDASDLPADTKQQLYACPLASLRCPISVTGLGTPDLSSEMLASTVTW